MSASSGHGPAPGATTAERARTPSGAENGAARPPLGRAWPATGGGCF
jgi:hypothetical protein